MSHTVLVDLDDPNDVARLWSEYAAVCETRNSDPEFLAILENLLPIIEPEIASEIRDALKTTVPAVVLTEWQDVFFAAKFSKPVPPVFARNQSHYVADPTISTADDVLKYHRERDRDDPSRLAGLVNEIARFTNDREAIVRTAVAYAETCGIDESSYVSIIAQAVRNLQGGRSVR